MEEDGDQETAEKEAPLPKERSKRNSKKPASYNVEEESEEELAAQKRGKANGKSAAVKKMEASNPKVEPEEQEMDSKESIEDLPKANKGRKRAPASRKTKSRAKKAGTEVVRLSCTLLSFIVLTSLCRWTMTMPSKLNR